MNKLYQYVEKLLLIGTIFFIVPTESLAEISLIDETAQSVTLEMTIPDFVISETQLSGKTYQTIEIAGMGATHEPGKPQLPLKGTLIAVPEGSEIKLEILESDTETLSDILLPPVPTVTPEDVEHPEFIADEESYQLNDFQPASPVQIGITGRIREQGVAQIQFIPVLHNPVTQEVILYKRLRVKVSFSNSTRSGKTVVEDSSEFDTMLSRLLINDATSNRVLDTSTRTTRANNCPPGVPAIKISIDKTGVYMITHADILNSLNFDMSVLSAELVDQIHMTHKGQAVPILLAVGEDGIFGPGDALFFYAEAATGRYTRDNIYWLLLNPAGGARLNFKNAAPTAHPNLSNFRQTVHVEENTRYWIRKLHDSTEKDQDHLFWEKLGKFGKDDVSQLDMPITLHHVAQGGNATIRVMLQGKEDDHQFNPDHRTRILLNGVEIDNAEWNGQEVFLQKVIIPQSQLREGANTVTLFSLMDTGAAASKDFLYVNWLEIEYTATTSAVENELKFEVTGSGQHKFTVKGFSQPDPFVLDVTNPLQIVPLLGATISPDGAQGHQIEYADQLNGSSKTYYAFSLSKLLKPAALSFDLPTIRLKSSCPHADYLLIYHDSFNINALQSLIAARGKKVMAVQVSDIYDEFNHGLVSPQAIKDFITYAFENYAQPRPAYVLFVGDANQDTLNELGNGINYIPTYTFHTTLMGETATDNWFVSVSGEDALPDMFLGRIPVRTQAELNAVVNKMTKYPKAPLDGWEENVLFVADNDEILDFERLSERLISKHLADYIPKRVYLGVEPNENEVKAVKQSIIDNINAGAIVTNYTGHGSINLWAGEVIFASEDVDLLNNPNKLTFVVALNCQNGWFSYYKPFAGTSDSFAEIFLKADNKGAIGMFAPTGLSYTPEHELLADEFFKRLFKEKKAELGPLINEAKIAATVSGAPDYILEMFTLFGDPNLRLRVE